MTKIFAHESLDSYIVIRDRFMAYCDKQEEIYKTNVAKLKKQSEKIPTEIYESKAQYQSLFQAQDFITSLCAAKENYERVQRVINDLNKAINAAKYGYVENGAIFFKNVINSGDYSEVMHNIWVEFLGDDYHSVNADNVDEYLLERVNSGQITEQDAIFYKFASIAEEKRYHRGKIIQFVP